MNIHQALQTANQLHDSPSPRLDAELLLAHCLGQNRTYLRTWPERELSPAQEAQFLALMARRDEGEPVAYLLGVQEFWSLPLLVDNSTLIPRPDSELLVHLALERVPSGAADLLDLGTGTGALALALAHERPQAKIVALDYQAAACALARLNSQRLGLAIEVLHSNWFAALPPGAVFDVILSNPPYINSQDPHLAGLAYEPRSALVAADAGLADLRHIISQAAPYLKPGGWLLLEHGWQQGPQVRALLQAQGYSQVASHKDFGGNERVSLGQFAGHHPAMGG